MVNYQHAQEADVNELNIKTEFDNDKRKTFSERQRINLEDDEAMERVNLSKFIIILYHY